MSCTTPVAGLRAKLRKRGLKPEQMVGAMHMLQLGPMDSGEMLRALQPTWGTSFFHACAMVRAASQKPQGSRHSVLLPLLANQSLL